MPGPQAAVESTGSIETGDKHATGRTVEDEQRVQFVQRRAVQDTYRTSRDGRQDVIGHAVVVGVHGGDPDWSRWVGDEARSFAARDGVECLDVANGAGAGDD